MIKLFIAFMFGGCGWAPPPDSTYENPTTVGGEVVVDPIGGSCSQGHTVECVPFETTVSDVYKEWYKQKYGH